MSHNDFERFLERISTEPSLQEELAKLLGSSPDGSSMTVGEFAAVAAKHGFTFSEDDVAAQASDELGAEELESVAGGIGTSPAFQYHKVTLTNASIAQVKFDKVTPVLMDFNLRLG